MKNDQYQLFIILLIAFISFIGTSLPYPIFAPLFLHPSPTSIIHQDWDINTRSILLGIALAAYPFGQFIGSPILGSYSDHYGRKKLLLISLSGTVAGYLLSAIALQFNFLTILIFSRFLTGIMEGNYPVLQAMAIDLKDISIYKSFGKLSSTAAIGYVIGPLLGGLLSDKQLWHRFSYEFPFYIAALFSVITLVLVILQLQERKSFKSSPPPSAWQQFNLIHRFKLLMKNETLKYLLIINSIFTFAIDIFYEFGPVYLTGLWYMTPAMIALYNTALSSSLAVGSSWLPHRLSRSYTIEPITLGAIVLTTLILGFMAIGKSQIFVFILFALSGLSIAVAVVNFTIQISNTSDKNMQGEVMGAQNSFRMLGDTIVCLAGGFVITASVILPIAISSLIALLAAVIYKQKFFSARNL